MKNLRHRSFCLFAAITLLAGLYGCDRDPSEKDDPIPFVRLLEAQTLQSGILNKPVSYAVLLPPEYEYSADSFPVVYLLHGFGDNETAWVQGGNIRFYADQYATQTGPVIYVMPKGFNSYWVNKYNGNYPYMNMLADELVPWIDAKFRTILQPDSRAVMGYSMGGYGALILPAKNPDVFRTAVVLSMSFRTDQQYLNEPQSVFDYQWGPVFGGFGTTGEARLTDYFREYSPFHFFGNPGDPALSGQNYFIDCGDDEESLSETNGSLHSLLSDLGIRHEYRMKNGAHTWNYWHNALPEAFRYIGYAFRQVSYPAEGAAVDAGTVVPAERITELQLTGDNYSFRVVVPASYTSETKNYPVVYVLHDMDAGQEAGASQQLISLLNKHITDVRIQQSLIVEMPFRETGMTPGLLEKVVLKVKESFRTYSEGKYAVLAGNGRAGLNVYELMPDVSAYFNACLLFDAALPEDASANNPETGYYLDICDNGTNYTGYQSLYMSLRHNQIPHEYRVRQGTASHGDFLTGLDGATVFIKDNLKQ